MQLTQYYNRNIKPASDELQTLLDRHICTCDYPVKVRHTQEGEYCQCGGLI